MHVYDRSQHEEGKTKANHKKMDKKKTKMSGVPSANNGREAPLAVKIAPTNPLAYPLAKFIVEGSKRKQRRKERLGDEDIFVQRSSSWRVAATAG